MKIIASTTALCIVIGVSVFATRKAIQTEARKTRNSMPGMMSNPLEDGESLVDKVTKLNRTLESINKRLTRLEDITERETKAEQTEIKVATAQIQQDIKRLVLRIDTLAKEQSGLNDIPGQLRIIDANMRTAINAIDAREQPDSAPSQEIIKAMDWMVQKIDDIDGYFPPIYDFLGAVYGGDNVAAKAYPSVDLRLNEVILMLGKLQDDVIATRKLVTPYNIEPKKYPRPFETKN